MKQLTFFLFAFLTTLSAFANSFFPENDLWKEDDLYKRNANVTEEMFNKIIDVADSIYQPIAKQNNERLTINRRWTDATVNANASRFFGQVTVNMFGGLARRDEITPEGFALVLCHELGHAYGGTPYINTWNQMSAEGQADFRQAICRGASYNRIGGGVQLRDISSIDICLDRADRGYIRTISESSSGNRAHCNRTIRKDHRQHHRKSHA